ncbi:MAG: hypothetical protein OEZ16_12405 [Chromatiales bacterium]|nr:hypothetical protein [Chromatiales bacterium]
MTIKVVQHILGCIAVAAISVPTSMKAAEIPPDTAFCTTRSPVSMTDEWKKQRIRYESKIEKPDLVISLGQQTHPALQDFVQEYAREKGLTIDIQQGTCGVTSRKLVNKSIDLGAFCCPPGESDRLPGLRFHTIGIAPIALVINTYNPIHSVSLTQARNIFQGEVVNWSELPQSQRMENESPPILPVVRLHCKKRPGHWRLLLDTEDKFSPRVFEVGVIPDMITEVSRSTTAIGYETLFMLDVYKDRGELKILQVDEMHPADLQHLIKGEYPIYRTYNLTTWNDGINNSAHAEDLVKRIKQHIEEHGDRYGFIPVSRLKDAGWKFDGDELVAEPDGDIPPGSHL